METKNLEQLSMEELRQIKGGDWVFINGEWVWRENDEGEDEGPGLA